jgi:hypothetical protein
MRSFCSARGISPQPVVTIQPLRPTSPWARSAELLWQHPEGHVARKRAAGCYHLDFSGGRAGGYGGRDSGTRYHRVKTAAAPLKLTLVAPVRSVPRISTVAPTLPEVGSVSTNGPRPTDRLKTVPSRCWPRQRPLSRRSPIGGLDQPRVGVFAVRAPALGAEAVKRRQRATRSDFEDRPTVVGPAKVRCPVEVPIGGLDQPRGGVFAVRAAALGAEAV